MQYKLKDLSSFYASICPVRYEKYSDNILVNFIKNDIFVFLPTQVKNNLYIQYKKTCSPAFRYHFHPMINIYIDSANFL